MTMQLLRHVAYQSVGGELLLVNQLLRDQTAQKNSGFRELDTEIRRMVANLLQNRLVLEKTGTSFPDGQFRRLAVECPANDRLESLFVRGVFHLAHIAPGTVRLQREELFFQ